ncbi:hypothetical protein LTR36_002287 [Oleoguttula mirabilis]|uniref:Uncharacterized protein n=1 Tax=Oleoguttula mirabilis TaxID=1507867 RepID=A0AAV9JMB5_9PEZI|nr:hypothetical protein LTR36_002287 [Oleoguttula mirabilis]
MFGPTRSTLVVLALGAHIAAAAAVASTTAVDLFACLNTCYAIDRSHAVDAIDWFCTLYGGRPIGSGVTGNYLYTPANLEANEASPHVREQGNIFMSIVEVADYQGVGFCPTNVVPYNKCIGGMLAAVDLCNTNTVKHKQGGWYVSGCMKVTVNPNPGGCSSV